MKCHYCGEEIREGSRYCLFCGTRQEQAQPVIQETPAEPEKQEFPVEELRLAAQNLAAAAAAEQEMPRKRVYTRLQLPTKRGLGKMFFLGLLTAGIYPMVIWSRIVMELNLAACRYDGKRTVSYFGMILLTPITLGIFPLVWIHNFCNRVGDELKRRQIDYKFSAKTFWLWGVLGSFILAGPFVFTHKLMQSMNRINADFNERA